MKKSIAIVFAALSVATFGCKEKAETVNPDEASAGGDAAVPDAPAEDPVDAPVEEEGDAPIEDAPEEGTPAEGGDE